ncbi:MAG TPA: SusC/RagA family TonB-linked outer membrane protein [Puia sp.]|nr:SusC/RagA family TonB-linked outer membrane protein [Puia sp.]
MRKSLMLLGILVCCSMLVFAQTKEITGKVTDSKGTPIPGVTVKIKGLKSGTSADADGTFKINASPSATLIISGVGFEPKEVRVGNLENLSISLRQSDASLSEVVVTALGIKREKRLLTYATQEVKGTSLVEAKQNNLVNALAGKVAGVQVTNSSGMPGSSAQITIRGNSTLVGDNTALFVIDGIPMDNGEAGNPDGSLGAGGTTNRGSDIDPNIIESINVLKGGAATALYGSRASKGAIIITTKNGAGKNGKPSIAFSSSYSFENPILPKFQHKYAQGSGGVYVDGNNGQLGSASWGPLIDTLKVNGVSVQKRDNVKDYFKTGHTTDNNVTVSGTTEKSNYVVSYSYLKTDGTEPNTSYSRHAFFGKFTTKLLSNLTLTTQFNYIHSDNPRLLEGNSLASPLWTIYAAPISWNPFPYVHPDGSQQVYRAARNNPYWLVNNTGLDEKNDRIIPVINLTYSPLSWLSITERFGADMFVNNLNYHENIGIIGSTSTDGRVYTRENQTQNFNHDLFLEARKNLGDKFFLDVIAGNNVVSDYNNSSFVSGVALAIPGFYNVSNASNVSASYNYYKQRKVGFYAQATLEYMKMLTLNFTGRYDGSSVLSQDKQFYPYGSASAGFIFTEPLGMANNPIFNFGKLRVSYSAVGGDNVPPYSLSNPYLHNSVGNIVFPVNGQNGFQLTSTYAYPLKNESVNEFEAGLETKFFQNRVSLDLTYFDKKSKDLLTPGSPLPPTTGFSSANINAGDMTNKGVEIVLGLTPIRTKDFTWDLGFNFTKIKNQVIRLAPGIPYLQFAGFTNPGIFAFPGKPYGVIYGSHFLRDSATNKLLLNDNAYPQVANDLAPIGNVTPKWIAGLTSTLTYKAFSFSFVLDYKHGGDILNLDNHYLLFYGTPKVTENRGTMKVFDGIIQSTGKQNTQAVALNQNYYQNISSIADESSVEDGSYFKLRQASLGYNFSSSLLKGTIVKGLTLTVTGTNFILWKKYTGSDPEVSLNGSGNGQGFANFMVPSNHNIIIGLRASF